MSQGTQVLDFSKAKPSVVVHVLKFAATTRRRGRIIANLVTHVCPLALAALCAAMAMTPTIDGLYGWEHTGVAHGTFAVAAAVALARGLLPDSGRLANLFVVATGWALLGRAWSVWVDPSPLDGWSRAVAGMTYAAIVLLTLTVHLLHVALLLAKRAEQASEAVGGGGH